MKDHISPATVIATVALFFSLGGAGMAATGYRITSIWQIAPKVRHQLTVGHLTGDPGPAGPAGPTGPQGPAGPQGPPGRIDWSAAYNAAGANNSLSAVTPTVTAEADCNLGDHVLYGGYSVTNATVTESRGIPAQYPAPRNETIASAWTVTAHLAANATGGLVQAWATCVPG